MEFIRLDLVLPGAVASADALQAVVGSGHEAEAEAMEIVGCGSWRGSPHISARKTRADMGERRRTARNILAQRGVTDGHESLYRRCPAILGLHLEDLLAAGMVEPILQVDAIRPRKCT